jgi:hypothetical protein
MRCLSFCTNDPSVDSLSQSVVEMYSSDRGVLRAGTRSALYSEYPGNGVIFNGQSNGMWCPKMQSTPVCMHINATLDKGDMYDTVQMMERVS